MDLTFQFLVQYCSLQHSPCFHHQSHPQLGVVFALAPSLHSFWSYFSTDLQQHIGHLLTWGAHLSVSYLFAFSYCSWDSQGKNTEVVCQSLFQWTTFCQNFPPWPVHLGWPSTAWLICSLSYTTLWSMWSDWLVFCDCGFQSVCPLMEKDKRLKLPNGRDWLRGKLDLVLMAMLSESLIQFSIDGWSFVPFLIFTWAQTMVEVMKIMATSFKRSHACTAALSAPNPAAGHHWPMPLQRCLDTHGQVWVSLLWGHCSFLLGPGAHKVLFMPFKSLFPSPVQVLAALWWG